MLTKSRSYIIFMVLVFGGGFAFQILTNDQSEQPQTFEEQVVQQTSTNERASRAEQTSRLPVSNAQLPSVQRVSRTAALANMKDPDWLGATIAPVATGSSEPVLLSSAEAGQRLAAAYQNGQRRLTVALPFEENLALIADLKARDPFAESSQIFIDGQLVNAGAEQARFYTGTIDGDASASASLQLESEGQLSGFVSVSGENYRIKFEDNVFSKQLVERTLREDLITQLKDNDAIAIPTRRAPVPAALNRGGGKDNASDAVATPERIATTAPHQQSKSLAPGADKPTAAALPGEIEIFDKTSVAITQVEGWSDLFVIEVPEGQAVLSLMAQSGGWVNFYVSTTVDPSTGEPEYCGEGFEQCVIPSPPAGRFYIRAAIGGVEGSLEIVAGYAMPLTENERIRVKLTIDSDGSFFSLFNEDSTQAQNYIGQLFNYIAPIWDSELKADLVVGDVYLHSTNEPEVVGLETVTTHFEQAHGDVDQANVHFLTASSRYSGGVAYIDTLCDQAYGFGISGIDGSAPNLGESLTWDPNVVAHELGHSVGSPHTHDYQGIADNPDPIDQCTSGSTAEFLPGEDSLTGGALGGGTGTIMSYCDLIFEGNEGGITNLSFKYGDNHGYGVAPERAPALMRNRLLEVASAKSACMPIIQLQPDLPDFDNDGLPDETDLDDDNDGVSDAQDFAPLDSTEAYDFDGDGLGDNADPDDDNDNILDVDDILPFRPSADIQPLAINEGDLPESLISYVPSAGLVDLIDIATGYGTAELRFFPGGVYESVFFEKSTGSWTLADNVLEVDVLAQDYYQYLILRESGFSNLNQVALPTDEAGNDIAEEYLFSTREQSRLVLIERSETQLVFVMQKTVLRYLLSRPELLIDPELPVERFTVSDTDRYYFKIKGAGLVPFETSEIVDSIWAIGSVNRLASNTDFCTANNPSPGCGDLVFFDASGNFAVKGQNRTGTWQIDERGQLTMLQNETGDTKTVIGRYSRFQIDSDDGGMLNTVHLHSQQGDAEVSGMELMVLAVADSTAINSMLDQNLTSSFTLTQPQYPRLENGDVVDGLFGFNLRSDGTGINYLTGSNFPEGLYIRPEFNWYGDDGLGAIVLPHCYYTLAEVTGDENRQGCYYENRRTWQVLAATPTELYVLEGLQFAYDNDLDGEMDTFDPPNYRPNFYQVDDINLDDLDGDGFANWEDEFVFDPKEWRDLDGDGVADGADDDRDGDGIENGFDAYPDASLGDLNDTDGDGAPDNLPERISPLVGDWVLAGEGSFRVGPAPLDGDWFSAGPDVIAERGCLMDDVFAFGADGTFTNVQDSSTWLEGWQNGGAEEGCGTPVAPHDGGSSATYTYDADTGMLTIDGLGGHLGLPKAVNEGELGNGASIPGSVTYQVDYLGGAEGRMTVYIESGAGVFWTFDLMRASGDSPQNFGEGMLSDAFVTDPNASLDTDGDGMPDNWNPGYDGTGSDLILDDDDDGDGVLDVDDALPQDPNEQLDTDRDGIGNNADDDDDGDGYHDQTEANFATDPLNVMNYPYSGGRVGLAVLSDYSDRNRAFYEVVVKRHLSGQGEVSIDYRTSDGGAAVAGEHFEMVSGTLTWADGDQVPKVIQVPLLGGPGGTRAQYDFGVVLDNLQGNAMYDATMGRVVLDDTVIDPNWSGNILPAYRTVAAEGELHEVRFERTGGSKGALTATIGYREDYWGENPYIDSSFSTTISWADGEVGPKIVTVPVSSNENFEGGNRRWPQIYAEVLDIESEDGFAQWFGQPWVGLGDFDPGAFSVMVIDDEAGTASGQQVASFGQEDVLYFNSGYFYSIDYDVDPTWWVYRQGADEDQSVKTFTVSGSADNQEIELIWEAYDVSPRAVMPTPDRQDPDFWSVGAQTEFGFDAYTFNQSRSRFVADLTENDSDGDGVVDLLDFDADNDEIPNHLDGDADGDGLSNAEEILNNRGNWLDADSDDDGVGDAEDQMPYDADEIYDFDGDGIGDNADDDDDNDGTPDAVENESGTDPFDAGSFPGSGGLISARSEVVVNVDRNDGQGRVIEVRVNRLLSGNGEVSVDYTAVDGPVAFSGEHYEGMAGTLVWADGDMSEKIITIPVVDRYSDQNRAFSVELSNAQGGAQLKGWHVSAVIGLGDSLEQPEGYQGRIETGSYNDHFAEGETFEIPVSRIRGGLGAVSVAYQVVGCEALIDVDNSSPLTGTLEWNDGDQSDQSITLSFLDDANSSPFAVACGGSLQLLAPENLIDNRVSGLPTSRGFDVLDNDFPEGGVVTWAQRNTFVEEGAGSMELRLIRLGVASDYQSVTVDDPSWIYDLRQTYGGAWRYAQPGLDYVSVGMQGGYMAEWQPYDRSPRVISLALSDDPYSGREKLIMNQLTLATGETDYFYGYVLNYERPDLGRDSDGDGIIDALDIDLDGDGIWNAADTDRDGDGVDNDLDSHPNDPNQSVDTDADSVGDNLDWAPEDPLEQFDSDNDGTGNYADADDDNDGQSDVDEWTCGSDPLDAGSLSTDLDNDGIPNCVDPDFRDDDGDGLPDEWEEANGLDPTNPEDAFFDPDQDGYLNWEEFLSGSDPLVSESAAQVIYTDRSATLIPGRTSAFTVRYTTTDANPNLSGMGVRVHFNAAYVSEVRLDNVFQTGLLAVGEVEADTFDLDGDIETDQFILVSWASFSGPTWPGDLPTDLFDVVITTTESVADLDFYPIRFSVSGTSTGYNLSAPSVYNPVVLASLDVDGDGQATALTDGLMVIRRLFGFSGTTLINGALSGTAVYTSPEDIADRIDAFGAGFDVDADGKTTALTDGLMIIRRLFGFSGSTLVNGALSGDATRTDPAEIAAYIDSLSP